MVTMTGARATRDGVVRKRGVVSATVRRNPSFEACGIPYTIVRATQFMEFLGTITASSVVGNTIRLSPGLFQPMGGGRRRRLRCRCGAGGATLVPAQ
jgi:hypothetical protein